MVLLIVTEAMIFAALLSAYFFVRANSPSWPQGGIEPPELGRIGVFTRRAAGQQRPAVLGRGGDPPRPGRPAARRPRRELAARRGVRRQPGARVPRPRRSRATDNAYASLFIVITGLHGLHLLVGLAMSVVVQLKAALGWFDAAPPRDRDAVLDVLALRRRRVDLRVRRRSTCRCAGDRSSARRPAARLMWWATFGSIAAWIVHLTGEAALVPAREAHPDVVWLMHGLTLALAFVVLAGMWFSWRLARLGDRRRGRRHTGRAHRVPRLARARHRRAEPVADRLRGVLIIAVLHSGTRS